MLISVAMATYNGELYLGEQLHSLASQTAQPAELVICDDGSTDETINLIKSFSELAPFPVLLCRNEINLGFRANFLKAVSLCQNDLVAFSDQDDVWRADKLERIASAFSDDDVMLVHHNAVVVDASLGPIRRYWTRFSNKDPLAVGPPCIFLTPPGFACIFRRKLDRFTSLWSLSLDFEGKAFAHDYWFFFLSGVLGKATFIDEDLVFYRQHHENVFGYANQKRRFLGIPSDVLSPRGLVAINSRLSQSADWYSRQRRSIESRIGILERLYILLDAQLHAKLDHAMTEHRALLDRLNTRERLYRSRSPWQRFALFLDLLRKGGYEGGRAISFERRALLRDLLFGVPFGSGFGRGSRR